MCKSKKYSLQSESLHGLSYHWQLNFDFSGMQDVICGRVLKVWRIQNYSEQFVCSQIEGLSKIRTNITVGTSHQPFLSIKITFIIVSYNASTMVRSCRINIRRKRQPSNQSFCQRITIGSKTQYRPNIETKMPLFYPVLSDSKVIHDSSRKAARVRHEIISRFHSRKRREPWQFSPDANPPFCFL